MTQARKDHQHDPSHLFLVRLWLEESEGGGKQWCGKVQHVVYGEAQYFQNWTSLIANFESMLQAVELNTNDEDDHESR